MARKPRTEPRRPNPVARTLAQPKFRRLVVQDKRRKPPRTPVRHEADSGVLAFCAALPPSRASCAPEW